MLPPLELTEAGCISFQDLVKHHPYPDFRMRALQSVGDLEQTRPYGIVERSSRRSSCLKWRLIAAREGKLSQFYLDESIPNAQRACSPKGHIAAYAGVLRHHINVIGVLDFATGKVWHDLHGQSITRRAVVDLN